MIIENPESLKEWLTTVLEPMCEADPTALAKYVIALVKKDKPITELRETCIDQLDVFLQQETKPFVELLFKTLDSKSYLVKAEIPDNATVQLPPVPAVDAPLPASPVNNVVGGVALSTSLPNSVTALSPASKVVERRASHPEAAIDGEDRDSKRQPRKAGGTSHSRSRSRSRSRNRSRSRSRSPPKLGILPRARPLVNERDERDRRGPRRIYGDDDRRRRGGAMGRRHDRYNDYRRDRSRERQERKRSRSRSKSTGRSRSRSRSKDRNRQRNDGSQKNQSQDNQDHGDTDYRLGGNGASGTAPNSNAPAPVPPPSGSTNANSDSRPSFPGRNARRCRDYDEKGYCMRGDLCPFDHGADPVVVEEAHLPTMLAYGPGNPSGPPPPIPQNSGPRPPVPPPGTLPPLLGPHMSHQRPPLQPPMLMHANQRPFLPLPDPYIPEPYNPEAPAMDRMPPRIRPPFWGPRIGPGRGPNMRPMPQYQHAPRELINVPTVDDATMPDDLPNSNNRRVVPPQKRSSDEPQGPPMRLFRNVGNMGNSAAKPAVKRRPFDFNRLGNRKFNVENAVLELRKIPHGLNSITQLNNHFSRFGKIVNLQVSYEGDPEAALIQFSSHAEAHAAYRSTEAVLNNRFIKVFWHNKDNEASPPAAENNTPAVQKVSAKERLGLPVNKVPSEGSSPSQTEDGEKSSVIMATSGTLSKTVFNPAALKKSNVNSAGATPNQIKALQVITTQETIKKKQEEQRKEAIKINADLQKRKQELLQKQIQQQKLLIEKLEKNKSMPATERNAIMKTLKMLQESIEKLKAELVLTAAAQNNHPKTKQEAQKEILDIEMELYNKQHQGADTSHLKRKVAELKQEALSLGLIDGKFPLGRGRGVVVKRVARGGAFRGRGRGVGGGARSLDHRPRKLQITGFEENEKEEVIAHLNQYGEIESLEAEEGGSRLIITYRNRREAETAVVQGAKYKGGMLVMMWYQSKLRSLSGDGHDGLIDGIAGEDELLEPELENEDLLLVDDDEEEDSEARSWRR